MRVTHTDTSSPEQRFGAQVREAREGRGWSQEALARHLRDATGIELHQTAIARLERGERTIRFNEVSGLAKLLGIDLQAYSAALPALTSDEYDQAKESLEQVRAQEERAKRDVLRLQDQMETELAEVTRERRMLADHRRQLEEMIRAYEERQRG